MTRQPFLRFFAIMLAVAQAQPILGAVAGERQSTEPAARPDGEASEALDLLRSSNIFDGASRSQAGRVTF